MSTITPSLQEAGRIEMLDISLLGKPVIRLGHQEVSGFRTTKSLALLCYLAAHPEAHSRQSLTGLLWSDDSEEKAQNSLRVALSNLNKLLPDHLEINRLTVALRADNPYRVDIVEFEQLTDLLSQEGERNEADAGALAQAAALYGGDFLDDLHVAGAPIFEEWLLTQRTFYRERMLATLEAVAEAQLADRSYATAVQTLERLLVQEPWHEAAYRQLMVVYSRMGDFNRALAYYERCRAMLAAELDVTPMPETEALHERIEAARRASHYELPAETTPFLGREEEVAQVRQMLADPACRLITICGLGGMGKSRLALALARQTQRGQAQSFLNGVVWVSLAGPSSAESLSLSLVSALRLPLSGQMTPQRQLLDFLQNKEMLLVIDNVTQVAEGQSQLLGQILAACPDVKLLVTSWEPLNLAAEWRFDLAGLSYPRTDQDGNQDSNQDALARYGAVQLFVQSARQVRPTFQLTADDVPHVRALCQLVGGMPLALKLAAAWLRMIPVQEIVQEVARGLDVLATQMQDVPPRQRSMRAIFEHTWELLTRQEQRVMASLSVFRGGFRRQAAEQVAGATLPVLTVLVDRSLLQVDGNGRYALHHLLRQFAAEKLAQDADEFADVPVRYANYYADLLEQLAKPMLGHGQRQALATISAELENVRHAWQQAVERVDIAALEKLMDVFFSYYDMRGLYRAAINLLEEVVRQLLRQPTTLTVQSLLAKFYVHLGWSYIRLGQYEKATEVTTRSQNIYRATNLTPPRGLGTEPLVGLGVLANIRGDYAEAFRLGQEACRLSEARGDTDNLQNAYAILTSSAFSQGRYAKARQYARQAHHLATLADNQSFLAYILDDLGMIANALGNYDEAAQFYGRSYALREEFDDTGGMAITSMHMAEVALHQQRWDEAIERYTRSLKSHYENNDRGGLAAAHEGLGRVAAAQGDVAEAQRHFHTALQTASQIGFTPVLLSILTSVAEFLLPLDRQELALTVLHLVNRHPSSHAGTLQRAAHLLAAHDDTASAQDGNGEEQEALDALVVRLLVELAIQHR